MVLSAFRTLIGFLKHREILTDDFVFRFHYKFTSTILVAFSILVTSKQFFGNPISCMPVKHLEPPSNLLDNYCWSHSTFTLPRAYNKPMGFSEPEVAYDGIDKQLADDRTVYHAYYQWVCFFLCLQAILFCIPRYIWDNSYGDTIESIIRKVGRNDTKEGMSDLAAYIWSKLGRHRTALATYVLCEILNLGITIGQMYFTDLFLRGEFLQYGLEVLSFPMTEQSNRTDPMVEVFPLVTKCKFPRFGVGGSVEIRDTLCVLPVNVINEKIFIFLWFWYIILAVLSACWILRMLPLAVSKRVRRWTMSYNEGAKVKTHLENVMPKCNLSDWFLLTLMKQNLTSADFQTLAEFFETKLITGESGENEYQMNGVNKRLLG